MNKNVSDKITPSNARAILQDCRGIAARRLPALIYEVLKQIKADLMEIAPSTQKYELFALYREALDITQGRWSMIESRFRTHFLDEFDRQGRLFSVPTNPSQPAQSSAFPKDFSLMDTVDLEESLAANTLANAIKSTCVNELMALNPRIGTLFKDPEFLRAQNPLGAEVIGQALMETLRELEGSMKAKLVLVPLFSKYLPSRTQAVYQEINQHLFNKGVLPSLQVHSHSVPGSEEDAKAATEKPAKAVSQSPLKAVTAGAQDMFGMLQQLMTLGRIGTAPAKSEGPSTRSGPVSLANYPVAPTSGGLLGEAGATDASAGQAPQVIFLNKLTRWQQGDLEELAPQGFKLDDAQDGKLNILHNLRETEAAHSLGEVDRMTLDIVALLFDFILDDRRIPDAMKALIGRLQIPLLKVALIDKTIFSNKSHPARQLLDTLAKAAMGWNAEEGHESNLYQKISQLVQRLIKEFDDDLTLIDTLLADLKSYLDKEQSQAVAAATSAAQHIQQQETSVKPNLVAREEIQRRLEYQALPKLVRQFMSDYWEQLLIKIYTSQGPNSETWIKAITTMDDLIWSVTPKNTSQDRKKLLVILPKLLKWLDQGLQYLGIPHKERDPFFTELVKYHTEAVRPGLDDEEFARHFDIALSRGEEIAPIADEGEDFEKVVSATTEAPASKPDPALTQEIAQTFEAEMEPEEIVIGDVTWAHGEIEPEAGAPGTTDYDLMARSLKRGTWIEMDQDNGESLHAKLAWVSPLRGVYLFTDRLGQKAISINASGLAAKFREGRVRIIDNVPLMDRAVSGLINRLQKSVS
jgi:hypothetical protein